jgi:hypothetical protein
MSAGEHAESAPAHEPAAQTTSPDSERCLDCGAPVMGAYCQRCGQEHGPPVEPLGRTFANGLADLGGVDGRIFRTLKPLFTRPGFLTEEYLVGRHTRYVQPLRLYLVASAIFFAVFFWSESTRFFFLWITADDAELITFVRRLPQLMFLLLPFFAWMVGVLHRSRRRLFTAHVVFALHFHSFAFLVLPVTAAVQPLLRRISEGGSSLGGFGAALGALSGLAELAVLVYLYLALRRCYGGGRWITAAKAIALLAVHGAFVLTVAILTVGTMWQRLWGR